MPDQASRQQKEDETLEGAGDLAASYGGFVVGLVSPNAATVIGMADMVRTGNRDFPNPGMKLTVKLFSMRLWGFQAMSRQSLEAWGLEVMPYQSLEA